MRIPAENTVIPQGSRITIQTLGLVGAKYMEITLPKVKPDEPMPPPIEPGSLVMGQDPCALNYISIALLLISVNSPKAYLALKLKKSIAKAAEEFRSGYREYQRSSSKIQNQYGSLN